MFKKLLAFGFLSIVFFSCKKSNFLEGYTRDTDGYYFKLIGIGDGNDLPKKDQIIVADATMKTQSDSLFWDTGHDASNGIYIDLGAPNVFGSCHPYLMKLTEGDSASFLIKADVFFKTYFDTVVPLFCKHDSLIKIDLKINQFISKYEYTALKNGLQSYDIEDTELQELQLIDSYLLNKYQFVKPDNFGIYTLQKTTTNNEKVSLGKRIKIALEGFFIDGKPLDGVEQQLEFVYGTPDQLIKGLNIVIGSLKKGETAKIIVPSRLAFGELGSSNGSVKPYTPLVYNIKIIDIK